VTVALTVRSLTKAASAVSADRLGSHSATGLRRFPVQQRPPVRLPLQSTRYAACLVAAVSLPPNHLTGCGNLQETWSASLIATCCVLEAFSVPASYLGQQQRPPRTDPHRDPAERILHGFSMHELAVASHSKSRPAKPHDHELNRDSDIPSRHQACAPQIEYWSSAS
jgi:hypothetical protein